jgi:hypothetical protein
VSPPGGRDTGGSGSSVIGRQSTRIARQDLRGQSTKKSGDHGFVRKQRTVILEVTFVTANFVIDLIERVAGNVRSQSPVDDFDIEIPKTWDKRILERHLGVGSRLSPIACLKFYFDVVAFRHCGFEESVARFSIVTRTRILSLKCDPPDASEKRRELVEGASRQNSLLFTLRWEYAAGPGFDNHSVFVIELPGFQNRDDCYALHHLHPPRTPPPRMNTFDPAHQNHCLAQQRSRNFSREDHCASRRLENGTIESPFHE